MQSPTISIYENIRHTTEGSSTTIDEFLEGVQAGQWQDLVMDVWNAKDDERAKAEAKKKLPCITPSGAFNERKDNGLAQHSGFIGIDIDKCDTEKVKAILSADKYVYAVFKSASWQGLCAFFRIDGKRHADAYLGIEQYLCEQYQIVCDKACKNLSRVRYVSFDPDLYKATGQVEVFKLYPEKEKGRPKKMPNYVHDNDDFERLVKEIAAGHINLCESYQDWVILGFAISSKYGEAGRDAFHIISWQSGKYDADVCDRQYNAILKAKGSKEAKIATFYHYCKGAGLRITSERTEKIKQVAIQGKKQGLTPEKIAEQLLQHDGITDTGGIIPQVMSLDITDATDPLGQLEQWLRYNYKLRKNLITHRIEDNGKPLDDTDINSIALKARRAVEKICNEDVRMTIGSHAVEAYNPILDFFEANKERTPSGVIDQFFDLLNTDDKPFCRWFCKKWLVGMISAIHGVHSPLMLVLCGEQNTGKTEFLRRLLPAELSHYYADSKLDAGKDDEILMCQKWLIMDDEMGGKSKKESKRLKELTSKQVFTLRAPYGRTNMDYNRIAVLCGTTNENEILNDPTGNRRIIPIEVKAPVNMGDYVKAYAAIDKTELLMEAYHLYKSGFEWQLTKEDIKNLSIHGEGFEEHTREEEFISMYYEKPAEGWEDYEMTSGIVKQISDLTRLQISDKKISQALKKLGFEQVTTRKWGEPRRAWKVKSKITKPGL